MMPRNGMVGGARHRGRWCHSRGRPNKQNHHAESKPARPAALSLFCFDLIAFSRKIIRILEKEPAGMIAVALQICLTRHNADRLIHTRARSIAYR